MFRRADRFAFEAVWPVQLSLSPLPWPTPGLIVESAAIVAAGATTGQRADIWSYDNIPDMIALVRACGRISGRTRNVLLNDSLRCGRTIRALPSRRSPERP